MNGGGEKGDRGFAAKEEMGVKEEAKKRKEGRVAAAPRSLVWYPFSLFI